MFWRMRSLAAALVLALMVGCGGGGGDEEPAGAESLLQGRGDDSLITVGPAEDVNWEFSGNGVGIAHFGHESGSASETRFELHLDLGEQEKDLYFIFTRTDLTEALETPTVSLLSAGEEQETLRRAEEAGADLAQWARREGVGLSGSPEISLFNSDPWSFGGTGSQEAKPALGTLSLEPSVQFEEGDRDLFYDQRGNEIAATCRCIRSADGKRLNLWVADDAWSGGGCRKKRCVTPFMVEALGRHFLQEGADNDIYNWVTGIFGAEWGRTDHQELIGPTEQLSILLMDIDGDNSTSGGVLGYYYARDNFRASRIPESNERLMFAIDSVLFASKSGSTWEASDYWPRRLLGTLAHELQHMVHYYQKLVLRGARQSEVWLNEMCSEAAVDLISARAEIPGPRGIDPREGTGTHPTYSTSLGRFVYYDYLSLTDWTNQSLSSAGADNILNNYGTVYAFGAYLGRNFGGAAFLRDVVQNGYGDHRAVEEALRRGGYRENFADALQKWGVAVLLSDLPGPQVPVPYRYNAGGFIEAGAEGRSFPLGSIDLYKYSFGGQVGPRVYDDLPLSGAMGRYPASNLYLREGRHLSGQVSRTISLPPGVRLSVVVR